jgi:hypothetical protein
MGELVVAAATSQQQQQHTLPARLHPTKTTCTSSPLCDVLLQLPAALLSQLAHNCCAAAGPAFMQHSHFGLDTTSPFATKLCA